MRIFKGFNRVTEDYSVENMDEDDSLLDKITALEARVLKLEAENINTTNCLYEIENRLQAQIDNIHPVTYNLTNKNWDQ
jgi:predicted  nucleic acid-binding Zn-ribbon protein